MKNFFWLLKKAYNKFNTDRCPLLASALVNAAIFSLFPLILGLLSFSFFILGSSQGIIEKILPVLKQVIPIGLDEIIKNIRAIRHTSIIIGFIGMLGFLWGSASIFGAIESSLNVIWKAKRDRSFIKKSLIGMAWAFVVWIILIASVGITFWASAIGLRGIVKLLPILNIIINTSAFCLIYRFFPNRKVKFKDVFIGAIFTGISWELAKFLFTFYVTRVVDYSKIFGSLSAFILLLLWLYYSAFIFLYGAELGYVYSRRKFLKKE
ncbi:MAG: YihY/virulence factor BrkB family protein [candidate division WOR-3 bacterium]|nr:YihY/virulence factor BrkB family protein [candidate division WOR-3 bacterium]